MADAVSHFHAGVTMVKIGTTRADSALFNSSLAIPSPGSIFQSTAASPSNKDTPPRSASREICGNFHAPSIFFISDDTFAFQGLAVSPGQRIPSMANESSPVPFSVGFPEYSTCILACPASGQNWAPDQAFPKPASPTVPSPTNQPFSLAPSHSPCSLAIKSTSCPPSQATERLASSSFNFPVSGRFPRKSMVADVICRFPPNAGPPAFIARLSNRPLTST